MYVTREQIQAANKAAVETAFSIAVTQFSAIEKLMSFNIRAVKAAFDDSVSNAKALLGARDTQELVALQSTLAGPALEKAAAYSKGLYAVAAETNSELSKLAGKQIADWNESFTALIDQASKSSPAGSDFASSAVKSFFAATSSAYDNMNKAAKQAGEIANANIAASAATSKSFSDRAAKAS